MVRTQRGTRESKPLPRVVEYRRGDGRFYLAYVMRRIWTADDPAFIKNHGILEVQVPNPAGQAWIVDLYPQEYTVIA